MSIKEQKRNCYNCRNPILTLSRYCCDEKKFFCTKCSSDKCRICGKTRIYTHFNTQITQAKMPKKNKCCNCTKQEEPPENEFFFQERCKMHYCHQCVLVFYEKYLIMIDKFQKQFGNTPQMQVELRCGCEMQTKKIISYIQKYCYDCSGVIKGKKMWLKNKCILMAKCYELIKLQAQRLSNNKAKNGKAKTIYYEIQQLIITCDNCKDNIDGQTVTIGEQIGDIYICSYCLKMSKQAEQMIYSKKIQQKQQRQQKQLAKQLKETKQIKKESKQVLKIDNRSKIQQKFEVKSSLKCQFCHVGITKLTQNQQICRNCFDSIEDGNDFEIIEEHPQQSKIKSLQNRQIVKQKLQDQGEEPRIEAPKPILKVKQSNIKAEEPNLPLLKRLLQSKIPIKSNEKELNHRPNLQRIQEQSLAILKQSSISVPSDSSSSKVHPQFFQPPSVTLIIKSQPQEIVSCSICSYQISSESCFRVYRREADKEATSRIAETQEELIKYGKENQIEIFCKSCYLKFKQKLKENERRRNLQRSEGARYGYSMAKREPKKDLAMTNASKICKFDDNYYGTGTLPKKVTQFTWNSPLQKREAQKQPISVKLYCKQCKQMTKQEDMGKGMCKECEMNMLVKSMKQKKEDEFQKLKCEKCKKNYTATKRQMGKMNICEPCLSSAHTAQPYSRKWA